MAPLSTLSLASAVVQFVDFGSKLLVRGVQLYRSPEGAPLDNIELGSIAEDLRRISAGLRTSRSTEHLVEDEIALWDLSNSCQGLADKILATLEDLVARNPRTKWNSVRQAFRSMWKEKEIRALEKRLDNYRSQLTIRLLATLRYAGPSCKVKGSEGDLLTALLPAGTSSQPSLPLFKASLSSICIWTSRATTTLKS